MASCGMDAIYKSQLSPVHTSNNVEATLSNATKSNVASTIERCFDVVAGVALRCCG